MTDLKLDMYSFLIKPIRDQDIQTGQEFVRRFLIGGQSVWQKIIEKIESIKKLWSVTECPDEFLQYLKRIVGWTPDLDHITEGLSHTALRRLIAVSVPIWKTRSTETSIIDALYTIVPGRARLWSWFELRWILDLTILAEEHQGRDPWLLDVDGPYWMNVRIVDNPVGTANKQLIKDMLNLMRPCGERFEIIYLRFLDLFEQNGDLTQWSRFAAIPLATDPVVEDGMIRLMDTTQQEGLWADVEDYASWSGLMVSARIRHQTTAALSGPGFFWYLDPVALNGYFVQLNASADYLFFGTITGGVAAALSSVDLGAMGISVDLDRWYYLRVQCTDTGATNRIKVFLDGIEVLDTTDGTYSQGGIGLSHTINSDLECDEFEVMPLPVESDTVEINY